MIPIKTELDIKKMAKGGKIASFAMREISKNIRPGITTHDLDKIANRIIKARGASPSFLGHQGFPACTCISINDEIVHAIPSKKKIQNGDIVKVDIGVFYEGFHTDMARTFSVGKISKKDKNLILACKNALLNGINEVKPGNSIGDIEFQIGETLVRGGLSPVMSFSGHGVGRELHEKPSIFCNGRKCTKEKLVAGMVIAIEPMGTTGNGLVERKDDGWTVVSSDKSMTVHFEDTVAVTENGHKVLTWDDKPDKIFL